MAYRHDAIAPGCHKIDHSANDRQQETNRGKLDTQTQLIEAVPRSANPKCANRHRCEHNPGQSDRAANPADGCFGEHHEDSPDCR